jgi:hypothetical protein
MGCRFFGSSSSYIPPANPEQAELKRVFMQSLEGIAQNNLPNPDPGNYKIIKHTQINSALVVKIQYLDCTNYEGIKVLVYANTTLAELKAQKLIDPHFSENKKFKSPIARFTPTKLGWRLAILTAEEIKDYETE